MRDNAEMDFPQIVLDFDQRIRKNYYKILLREIVKRQDILEKDNLEPLLSRSREKANEAFFLLCTLASNPDAKKITADITQWAINYVKYYDLLFIEACRDKGCKQRQ